MMNGVQGITDGMKMMNGGHIESNAIPRITIIKNGQEVEFGAWHIEDRRMLIGTMTYSSEVLMFHGCTYTAKENGTVLDSGEVVVPGGWKKGEPVVVKLMLPKVDATNIDLTIEVASPMEGFRLPN